MTDASLVKWPPDECNWILLIISQHWFRQGLGAVRQQAVAWANVDPDLCRHMALLGYNELTLASVDQLSHTRGQWVDPDSQYIDNEIMSFLL